MSSILLKFLNENASELYFKALKLMTIDSKSDPVTTPYYSHYKARDILKELLYKLNFITGEKVEEKNVQTIEDTNLEKKETNLENDIDNSSEDKQQLKRLTAVIILRLGINLTETEELAEGGEELEKCRLMLEAEDDVSATSGIKQEVLNLLGLLSSGRGDMEASLKYLEAAEQLHENFKNGPSPWSTDDFFRTESYNLQHSIDNQTRTNLFEEYFTHTLYFLAQVYGKMGRNTDSASYCKNTLARQLDHHCYEVRDWSMNAATLSQYYTSIGDFRMARHCLAAAETILKEEGDCPNNLSVVVSKDDSQEEVDDKEKLSRLWADLFRCWLKYCIALLDFSRERAYASLDGLSKQTEGLSVGEEALFNLMVTACENQVRVDKVLVFEEAREVFLKGQGWLNRAKEFYQLDGHCTDHVELLKDHSRLFTVLAFFEADLSRQCKMHKRRIDLLTNVLNQLNSQFYLALCCQLCFEVGEVYSSMLDNKLAITESQPPQTPYQAAQKINSLAMKSIEFFERYLKYLRNPQSKLPEKLEEGDERPVMLAHFYIARMYSKLITGDKEKQLLYITTSCNNYSYLVDYCKKHPSAAEKVKEERSACEEIISLLPAKMRKIKDSMNH